MRVLEVQAPVRNRSFFFVRLNQLDQLVVGFHRAEQALLADIPFHHVAPHDPGLVVHH